MVDPDTEDRLRRALVPLLGLGFIALYIGSRVESLHAATAYAVAFVLPLAAHYRGTALARPVQPLGTALIAGLGLVTSWALIGHGLGAWNVPVLLRRACFWAGLVAVVAAVLQDVRLRRRGVNSLWGAWAGIPWALAAWLGEHPSKDPLGAVLAAGIVGLFIGGGSGFFAGRLLGGVLARDANASKPPSPKRPPNPLN